MDHRWDPDQYLVFADERSRPFLELTVRIRAEDPAEVVDLGAGPGTLTQLLRQRWPRAQVTAVDASPEMIARARTVPGLRAELADLRTWRPAEPVDVIVANASLQWVPGHLDLLPELLAALRRGGWLALQVPGNFEEPSHALRRQLAGRAPYAAHLEGVAVPGAHDAATYLRALQDLDCEVDAWETTYLHVLHGEDPVLEWVSGTGARPTLQALPPDLREAFREEYRLLLREAYPDHGRGVVLPFRRVFAVARRR
ncbi:trans-aconitate 2-methyltransferase [Brachybacterium phenoliresistens]|uniref:Trans-aconitate 2-methyltransferase n=1 Tax=Brachybacterium phenoliresistens TaxID=396014 RepID=Z9JXB1_9MICO|nr:trans-aconitate 2-methyltransferase [Brachybacterium phenoliresistens]EWS82628.1 trans-aconitate methyltransferase [Brachybacterium phenoliresistens]